METPTEYSTCGPYIMPLNSNIPIQCTSPKIRMLLDAGVLALFAILNQKNDQLVQSPNMD